MTPSPLPPSYADPGGLRRILLTRAHSREHPDPFVRAIEALGLEVVPASLTRTRIDEGALDAALSALLGAAGAAFGAGGAAGAAALSGLEGPGAGGAGDARLSDAGIAWLLFTSAKTLRILNRAQPRLDGLLSALHERGTRIGAVGPATADALSRLGVGVDLLAAGDGDSLARALGEAPGPGLGAAARTPLPGGADAARREGGRREGARILLPRSGSAGTALVDRLDNAGWEVEEHRIYETAPVAPSEIPEGLAAEWAGRGFAAAVVTAPSSMKALVERLGAPRPGTPLLVLGAPSAEAAASLAPGCPVRIAARPTPEAIASLLAEVITSPSPRSSPSPPSPHRPEAR